MKKRKLYNILINEKDNRKVSVVLGARQVGKTTLVKQLHHDICLDYQGLYLDMDVLSNFERVSTYENLLNTIKLEGYTPEQKETFFLFLDEFQRYPGFSKILKNIYDHHNNIKLYVTGSSSIKIKDEVQESLAGRKNIHYLFPLDFEEFLAFKNEDQGLLQLKNISKLSGRDLKIPLLFELLTEYMIFGGYPEISLLSKPSLKIKALDGIFDLYVKKDLVEYLNIKRILNVKKLIEILAINHGQKIKYEELASTCSLKEYEIKNYIEILKETFLITEVRPYFTNKNKEIVKIPKIYFNDHGVRNYFLNNFNDINKRDDNGFLFESFVLGELLKSGNKNIKYWQDKNKREVDFIVDRVHQQIPIEVKFKRKIKQNDLSGLKAFSKQYPKTGKCLLISPNSSYNEKFNNINIYVMLPYVIESF